MGARPRAGGGRSGEPPVTSLLGILAIVVGLVVSVGLHELGHLVPAKRFGALVPEYAIGFGPALRKWRAGATEVVLRALPLGGYVRILGMFAPGAPNRRRLTRTGRPTLAEEARIASAEEIPSGLEDHAFYRLAWWRKAIVMAGGPAVNLVLALVLLVVAMAGIGSPTATLELASVSPTLETSSGGAQSPAAAAGLEAGDLIVSVDGAPITQWSELQAAVAASSGGVEIGYSRGGAVRTTRVTPVEGADGARLIGVAAAVEYRPASASQILSAYGAIAAGTGAALVRLPMGLWDVAVSLVTGAPRDGNGLVSIVGVGRIAGEVTGDSAALGISDARQTIAVLLSLLASLNMALGLFNLIPLPPLDGGHIAGALVEGTRSGIARLRGRPDPGPVDTARLTPLTWTVGALLVAMTLLLVVADLVRPIALR